MARFKKEHISLLLSYALIPLFLVFLQAPQADYQQEIESWRRAREARLKAEDGWLTVVGLFWLKEGRNTVGTDPGSDIVLPAGSAPGSAGQFVFEKGEVRFESAPGVAARVDGKPAGVARLKPDTSGAPDLLRINSLTMFVIQRGRRTGIRLKDANSPARKSFAGLRYFPIREEYRVKARWEPYDPPKKVNIPNVLGGTSEDVSPGYVEFVLKGRRCRLEPVLEGEELFFIFKDRTAAKETYPAGRFLYTGLPKGGEVVLDFNRAINPPCAFTPYATCPLPPQQNHLAMRIEAGELRYGHAEEKPQKKSR
jgi:uncharacterized protein (DUF1684 family)